jgi:hypothetical protein
MTLDLPETTARVNAERLASQGRRKTSLIGAEAPARAANLLAILEAEGCPSLRFLRAFADESRQVRRLVVHWLALDHKRRPKR